MIQFAPEHAPNNWKDCREVGDLDIAKHWIPLFERNNPSSRFRAIERITTITDAVIYLPEPPMK